MVTAWPEGHLNHCVLCARRALKAEAEAETKLNLEDAEPHSWKPDGKIETEIQE